MGSKDDSLNYDQMLKEQELQLRYKRAVTTILRGFKYIMGYLTDYGFEFKPNFSGNPLEAEIRVFWSDDMDSWKATAKILREKITKMEEELSSIKQGVPNAQVSKPIHND
jgi:hypothetical protein